MGLLITLFILFFMNLSMVFFPQFLKKRLHKLFLEPLFLWGCTHASPHIHICDCMCVYSYKYYWESLSGHLWTVWSEQRDSDYFSVWYRIYTEFWNLIYSNWVFGVSIAMFKTVWNTLTKTSGVIDCKLT